MIKKDKIVVGVHNGSFHPDDVMCVAMLFHEYGEENVTVIRTRDIEKLKKCDYILDVGCKDEITENQVWLDHHQINSEYYPNGVKMSACGKLANYLYADEPDVLNEMRKNFLYSIEAPDNGQKLSDFKLVQPKFMFVASMNANWTENESKNDEYFLESAKIAKIIFERELECAKVNIKAREIIRNAYEKSDKESGLLILPQWMPWERTVNEINEETENEKIIIVMFKSNDEYSLLSVPEIEDGLKPAIFPEEWAGLRNEEMANVSGYESSVFCHVGRFLAIFKDKEDAIRAALSTLVKIKDKNNEMNIKIDDIER